MRRLEDSYQHAVIELRDKRDKLREEVDKQREWLFMVAIVKNLLK